MGQLGIFLVWTALVNVFSQLAAWLSLDGLGWLQSFISESVGYLVYRASDKVFHCPSRLAWVSSHGGLGVPKNNTRG